jgi:Xaa-Pro aminopeptidase
MMYNLPKAPHPLLAERNQVDFQEKLQAQMRSHGIDVLLIFKSEHIYYSTGYLPKISEIPGYVGINLAVMPSQGKAKLIVTTLELEAAESIVTNDVEVFSYPSWVFIDDGTELSRRRPAASEIDPFTGLRKALEVIHSLSEHQAIAVEKSFVTVPIWKALTEMIPQENILDSNDVFIKSRMIKLPWEIDILRLSAQHNERTMRRVAQSVKPGMSCAEIDHLMNVYGYEEDKEFTADMNLFAAEAAGPYFGLSGIQRGYQVKEGDIIRFDGGFRHLGYVSDLARCFCVGKPTDEAEEIYVTLVDGFQKGIELLKPGTVMKDIYWTMVNRITSSKVIPFYPRGHMGHSVGMNKGLEEYPQISPTMDEVLKPNMVICVEAPIWTYGRSEHYGAFSIEDTFLITESGCERFTYGNTTLYWD